MTLSNDAVQDVRSSTGDEVITLTEASHMLHWSFWQVSKAINDGKLEAVKLPGNRRAVVRSSADALAKKLEALQ